ncbi:acetoacetyl-CoA synthase [Thiospirochaeta perfilievii]|uniref:Acetoacetyl-CoA synthase n=1 Tax=Thiospirochaeta perfilievii TaxID=252967 RepID=A0A5C1QDC5_9SPIO|nr:type II toxin-antitoxin system CcdA family antitoxin [Thiospirochaeta perfilievii]QEN05338.1 acetoacetyl-CoA synthase [Thiospirochaeta perfilievii]
MKTRTNVSIDKNLLDSARTYNIVISALLEEAIKQEIKKIEKDLWLKENSTNLKNYNERVIHSGVFSDDIRSF